ncbi:hypothetical protein [Burkholderia cepacia]|nr:hypothetical protein [Burkholderia cepacia]
MDDLSTNPGMTGDAVAMRTAKATVYPCGAATGPAACVQAAQVAQAAPAS